MINDIKKEAEERMKKSIEALSHALNRIRTGRAHPSILEGIVVNYYGADTPLQQLANINVEDSRTLSITPWEKAVVPAIEKAIMTSDLGLNPNTAGAVIRIPMPALTEETRKNFIKHAKAEAETARVSVRNIRRDANTQLKDLLKEKTISEDDDRRAQDEVQKITDKFVAEIDKAFSVKEKDLMEI
ncbi:MAG: ribosome recycling factor [Cellvibrionales bacterium]|jgi:ribosome recycling factor|nr:ribosome recycling factor [Cellvibrionales bacterium]MBK8675497.1 ribosome recycling factor [Cellvibrionales bacterium]HRF87174.1 ribosome recycling factor [Pseudomonadales bacterium]HRG49726.1 ribosome recycling factor [Pseudomonadales bacterium]